MNESRIGAVINELFAASASQSMSLGLHVRHGAMIHIGIDSDVTVTEPDRAPVRGRVIVVPPDAPHAASCPGPCLGLLYDPEMDRGLAGYARARQQALPLDGRLNEYLREAVRAHRASVALPEVLSGLARESATVLGKGRATGRGPDRRVARLLESMRYPLADQASLVSPSGISPAHLRELFVRDVGLPIRTYRLWRRVLMALTAFARIDATAAAHHAGFSDLAHFSRSCRRMLGAPPTELGRKLLQV